MSGSYENLSVFEQLKEGLSDSIAFSKGLLSLKTATLPAPPPKAGPRRVAALRRRLNMSQAVFAATLNVSPRTVQSWEQGAREPSDAALRMLQLIGEEPSIVERCICKAPSGDAGIHMGASSRRRGVATAKNGRTATARTARRPGKRK